MEKYEEVLMSLRQIIRANDLYSKRIKREFDLTSPQILLMKTIFQSGEVTLRQLSLNMNMSQATTTSILDRLEAKDIITRIRDTKDKRKVHARLTDKGLRILDNAPQMMEQHFITQFQNLETWEQNLLLSSLQRIGSMMETTQLDNNALMLLIEHSKGQ